MKKHFFLIIMLFCILCILLPITAYGKKNPSKKKKFTGVVTTKEVSVRSWAGAEYKELEFGPLHKGDTVDVCDTVKASNGKKWYYIRYKGNYGFVRAKYIKKKKKSNASKFVSHLNNYSSYVKDHRGHFRYRYDGAIISFAKAKTKVKQGKIVGITCVVPIRWALYDMKIKRKDGKSLIVAEKGSFKNSYSGSVKKKLKRITKGKVIGKTYKKAVDKKYLKKGDIIAFKGRTHTAVYTGKGYIFFDVGRVSVGKYKYKKGIKSNYSKIKFFKDKKISEVLRWR